MLNRTNEWFGHLAIQLAVLMVFVTFQQATYGFEVSSSPQSTQAQRPPTSISPLVPRPPAIAQAPRAATPLSIPAVPPQLEQYAHQLAIPQAQTSLPHPLKPHDETSPAAIGAKPSGKSVKPQRFQPKVQSADDPTDLYIVAQAQALNNDPNQIFAFVRDQIGFEVYRGSLRGARGTLWSKAGNALDRASLLVALLGASGISARYVEGTISLALEQQLILSMFPNVYQVTGCPPPNAQRADPANDPTLQAIVSDHFWIEFGPSFTPADPSFPGAQIGSVQGSPTNRFTTIPSALQHTVTFRLDIEQYLPAAALFGGSGFITTEVLNQTFATTDLVGVPVTEGNFVNGSAAGIVVSATTFTYSPYLLLGKDAANPSSDQLIRGQDYQEVYTNFSLGNQILTGIFLRLDVNDPGVPLATYERPMLDRIGYAARSGGLAVNLTPPAPPAPALTPLDVITVDTVSSDLDRSQVSGYQAALAALQTQAAPTLASVQNAGSLSPADQSALIGSEMQLGEQSVTGLSRVALIGFALSSQADTETLAPGFLVRPITDSPRLLLFASGVNLNPSNQTGTATMALDLRKDDITVHAYPGQSLTAEFAFRFVLGLAENLLESGVAQQLASGLTTNNQLAVSYSTIDILNQAYASSIPLLTVTPALVSQLSSISASPDALARMTAALQSGKIVYAPTKAVELGGAPRFGWYEIDPVTGDTVGVTEDGGHQSLVEFLVVSFFVALICTSAFPSQPGSPGGPCLDFVIGFIGGFFAGALAAAIGFSNALTGLGILAEFNHLSNPLGSFAADARAWIDSLEPPALRAGAFAGFYAGFAAIAALVVLGGVAALLGVTPTSPISTEAQRDSGRTAPRASSILPGQPPFTFAAGLLNGPPSPLSSPFVVQPDPEFSIGPGGLVPFTALIQNSTSSAITYSFTAPTSPLGYGFEFSLPSITIPAGQTGEIGLCVAPPSPLPTPGTLVPLGISATSTSGSLNAPFTLTMPSVQSASLSAGPASVALTPGNSATVALQIQSTGNVPIALTLTDSVSGGATVSGVPSTVTLNASQSVTQSLTIGAPPTATPGTYSSVSIKASWGASSAESTTLIIPVLVTATQALSADQASATAANLGRPDIVTTLSGLSGAIDDVVSSCSTSSQSEVLAYLNNLIQEMNAPFLQPFVSQLQSAQTAIASSTCGNITTALNQLSTVLANLNTALSSPAAFPFDFELIPNTAVAQPNQATQFAILLRNDSTTSNTYALSLGALPNGVTGNLNQTSITLAAGQTAPMPGGLTVTLTPSTGTAFQFSVTASINGLANSARTITGALTARNTFLQVEDVKATPGFTNAGGSVDVVTHIANVVNQNKTVQVVLTVKNSSNTTVLGPFTQNNVALSVQTLLTTVDFGQINTTGLANGDYSLNVTVIDPATSQPMPGGTGTGTLLIGSPVSATLTASPQTLAPGNGVVTSTLTVSSTGSGNGNMPFSLIGSAATASPAESVAINGTTVYTCDNNEVSVFNASNPSSPLLVNTAFANAIMNAANIFCDIQRGDLVMLADAAGTLVGNNPSFLAFDLTNPTSPSLIASTSVEKRFFGPPYYQGNTAFFKTQSITFGSGFPGPITDQAGDFVSLDVTNFSAPAVLGTVEQQTHGPIFGGSFNVYGITPFSAQLAYAASTTLQGADTQNGVGQLWVVNTTNPSAMSIVTQVNVPGTVQLLVPLVQGSTAVAIGDNGGWISSCCAAGQQSLTGNVVVAVFDLANPQNPQLAANVTTTFLPGPGSGAAVIGPHLFLYSGVMDASNNNFLMLVDTTDPNNPVITTYPIATPINVMKAVGSLLYAPTNSGLQIYSIPGLGAIQYTAAIQIAKNGTVAYNANSFSVPPTSTTPGAGFDTVTWVNPSSNTITWTSNVTGIQPGQVLPVDLGGTVSFTVPAGSGTITLPQADVNSDQIIGLSPATQTVAPGQLAAYMLTLKNPTASSITYNLAVTGVTQNWVTLPSFVAVAAGAQATIALNLRSEIAAIAGTYGFIVTATSGGVSGSVSGTLILQGTGTIGTPSTANALGVVTTLMPPIASGGPGTTTNFTVQLTNAGNVADTYNLSISVPAGVAANFDQTSVQVPPGLSNFRQILLHLTPAQGTPPGPINFTVTATSQTSAAVQGQATGTLTVTAFGVKVALAPQTTNPGTTLQMTITNTGRGSDTFDLALGGPAATVSTLAVNSVTLAAGQSQNVAVTVGAVNFASLGNLTLTATATSRGNTAVLASSSAQITIGPSKGISAAFSPASQKYTAPGPAVFLLQIQNTGTLEDGYTAAITGTTGPVQASLLDLYGNPAQTVSGFRLPGVSSGVLVLNAVLGTLSDGTVTVTITSTSDSTVKATATASLSAGSGGYPWWWWFFYAP